MFVQPINNYFKGFGRSKPIIAPVCLNLSFFYRDVNDRKMDFTIALHQEL